MANPSMIRSWILRRVVVGVLAEPRLVECGGLGGHDGAVDGDRVGEVGGQGGSLVSAPADSHAAIASSSARRMAGSALLLEQPAEPAEPGPRARRAIDRPEVAVPIAGEGEADEGMQQDRQVGDRPGDRPGMVEPGGEGQDARTLTEPCVGLQPATPQNDAGRVIEPPVWVPIAPRAIPQATAAADPLDDPPGVRSSAQGLRVGGGSIHAKGS